ncbi:MAG: alcohol dehydrogenase, partial [Verrucomicrobia bacterium]
MFCSIDSPRGVLYLWPVRSSVKCAIWLGVLAGVCTTALECAAEDWPRWRGPDLNGISKEKGWTTAWPREGPTQLWKASVGTGFSSVAVAQGRVFTLGNTGGTDTVYCFDAAAGKELWRQSYACSLDPEYHEGGPGAAPTVDGDKV